MKLTGLTPGTRVQHRGTKCWAVIVQAVPQRDGTYEYEVAYEHEWFGFPAGHRSWWASYHLGDVDRKESESS